MCVSVISRAKTNNLQQFCLAVPEVASKNVVAETDAKRRTDIGFVEGSIHNRTHILFMASLRIVDVFAAVCYQVQGLSSGSVMTSATTFLDC